MISSVDLWGVLRELTWGHFLIILAVLVIARLLVHCMRWAVRGAAERASSPLRLTILRAQPLLRLLIDVASVVVIVPILVEPTFRNIAALAAAVLVAVAFALKDYVSSVVAGVMTVLENTCSRMRVMPPSTTPSPSMRMPFFFICASGSV